MLCVEDLDECKLRFLYEQEGYLDQQIAERYGTYQVKISRMRSKWGIPTISMSDRISRGLLPLTTQQKELLLGSLLGDGCMKATSAKTARFIERHSLKQEGYLRWKAEILGDYVSSTYPVTKWEGDVPYPGIEFATKSCQELYPYFDLFYKSGKRVFPASLSNLLSPFSLAIWYLDDGSIKQHTHPSISFGLDSRSLHRATKALRALGLQPQYLGSGGRGSIVFPGQADLFYQIVAPHVPECMQYKLQTQKERRIVDVNAKRLTPERARVLYEGGMSLKDIADAYSVGRSTVRRRLQEMGVPRRVVGRLRPSFSLEAAKVALQNYDPKVWATLSLSQQETWVGEILSILLRTPFPFPSKVENLQKEFRFLLEKSLRLDGVDIKPLSRTGLRICTPYFPNRYKAAYRKTNSAWEGWHDPKHLQRAILFQLKVGDPVVPHRVLRALTANCRTPTVFRPTIAKFVYENYAPKGGKVWDPCSGYGGRLLGAGAAGVQYLGTDVEPQTVAGNLALSADLGLDAEVVLSKAEDFNPGKVDLVFTSPPYFNVERYSTRDAQSYKQHQEFNLWLEGFLRPVIRTSYASLGVGQYLILNVANINLPRQTLLLVESTCRLAEEEGFIHEQTLHMPLSNLNRKNGMEPLLVFKKGIASTPSTRKSLFEGLGIGTYNLKKPLG